VSTVHANSDDLRRFAGELESFAERTYEQIQALHTQFNGLDWDDAQQRKFDGELTEVTERLRTFLDAAKDLAPELRRRASHLDEFLSN
jgi:hypothetical protein